MTITDSLRLEMPGLLSALTLGIGMASPAAADITYFTPGDLVVSTVSNSTGLTNAAAVDSASTIVLNQFSLSANGKSATAAGTLTLPNTAGGSNAAISGEYGSASEGILQLSGNGQYLTTMGYGVNADTFNTAPLATYGTASLGQTTSLTGGASTVVPRVVALIGTNGGVDTSTALTGVFNTNNPRSAATIDGSSFYVSGQGASKSDPTQGVFLATKGATTATPIDNSTDTRVVSIVNSAGANALFVSRDFNPPNGGTQNFTNVSELTGPGGGLPTSSAGLTTTHITPPASPLSSGGNNGSINLTAALANGVNTARINGFVYLSPEAYFFADDTTLYIADSGQPKNGNANKAALGEGGLQKWTLTSGVWTLDYDMVTGLNLVNNANAGSDPTAPGVTGLFGLTGEVVGGNVELFATSYGLNELSRSFLYEITDSLANLNPAVGKAETFATLETAGSGTLFRGVSLAPAPEPASITVFGIGLLGAALARRRGTRK